MDLDGPILHLSPWAVTHEVCSSNWPEVVGIPGIRWVPAQLSCRFRLLIWEIRVQSLQEAIDTTTSGGKLIFHVFGALAEFERDIIRERTRAGLDAARARGKRGGRPRKLDAKKKAQALTLHQDKTNTIADICRTLRIGRTTLYRYLAEGRPGARLLPE